MRVSSRLQEALLKAVEGLLKAVEGCRTLQDCHTHHNTPHASHPTPHTAHVWMSPPPLFSLTSMMRLVKCVTKRMAASPVHGRRVWTGSSPARRGMLYSRL